MCPLLSCVVCPHELPDSRLLRPYSVDILCLQLTCSCLTSVVTLVLLPVFLSTSQELHRSRLCRMHVGQSCKGGSLHALGPFALSLRVLLVVRAGWAVVVHQQRRSTGQVFAALNLLAGPVCYSKGTVPKGVLQALQHCCSQHKDTF